MPPDQGRRVCGRPLPTSPPIGRRPYGRCLTCWTDFASVAQAPMVDAAIPGGEHHVRTRLGTVVGDETGMDARLAGLGRSGDPVQ